MDSNRKLSFFSGKRILITGGTGSFGQACVKKLLQEADPQAVIVFSRDEWKQWEMQQKDTLFTSQKMRYFLGDIRDKERLERAFANVDIVIHAAALKQVPAAEYNPTEFIQTNVLGAMHIIDAAIHCKVEKVVALSTDKAVNPTNLYGATKLCSDKTFIAANALVGRTGKPSFSIMRYGNVLNTRGSLLSVWQNQLEQGLPITVTDDKMSRFWITKEQAVDFVLSSIEDARGGEIYIPKMPSMKILDMAEALYPNREKKIIGIREGEKLHEMLISSIDARNALEFSSHFTILPEIYKTIPHLYDKFLKDRHYETLPQDFTYTSDKNDWWLTPDSLQEILKNS